jgi:hypothetical protein
MIQSKEEAGGHSWFELPNRNLKTSRTALEASETALARLIATLPVTIP